MQDNYGNASTRYARVSQHRTERDNTSPNGYFDEEPTHVPDYFAKKARFTRVLGFMLFIPASPVILVLIVLVYCTSRGPGIFRQTRVGKNGEEFTIYKLRTMCHDAEKSTGPVWSRPDDSRICLVGKILRFLHLDELPQLYNVIRGEMDVIGPRPERPEIVDELIEAIPGYRQRYRILPGITGLAQIHLPPDVDTNSVRSKIVLDELYIQTASWGLDTRILLCTLLRIFGVRHGHAVHWFGLDQYATNLVASHVATRPTTTPVHDTHGTVAEPGLAKSTETVNGRPILENIIDRGLTVVQVNEKEEELKSRIESKNGAPTGNVDGPLSHLRPAGDHPDVAKSSEQNETLPLPGTPTH